MDDTTRNKSTTQSAESRRFDVCIVGGAGHIGLPLGIAFAQTMVRTVLFDINTEALNNIREGKFPFAEKNGAVNLGKALSAGTLSVSSSPEAIRESKFIVCVIGTPIDEHLNPDFGGIMNAMNEYLPYFVDSQILILRSTVFPGTTDRIQRFFKENNKQVSVAFCPERIVEGNAFEELSNLPQIVSAPNQETLTAVSDLFRKLTTKKIIPVAPLEAELIKLFSNAWRYIKFAVANQFFMIASDQNLDFNHLYQAMIQDYPRNADLPRPGFASGPCLLKDTMQLAAFHNNNFFLGHTAMLVNEGLPNYIIQKLAKEVKSLETKTIGILGMAFKAESDDIRASLSSKLKKIASTKCRKVMCHDFHIKDATFSNLSDILKESDILILSAPHNGYREINPLEHPDKHFVDVWGFWTHQ